MEVVTEAGFVRPGYAGLLEAQQKRAKQLFGEEIDTGEQTALGKFIRIMVYDMAKLYEAMEGVYLSRFPHHALGVGLDRLTPFAGVHRNAAVAAVHRVKFEGTRGTVVSAGFLLATVDGVYFSLEAEVEIGQNGVAEGRAVCTKRGVVGNVTPGEICVVVNPAAGVYSAKGVSPQTVTGRERESDAELRDRFDLTVQGIGSATMAAVRAAVLRLAGVQGCTILENDSDSTDANGLPAHSFECFVLSDNATDTEIAGAIFDKKPVGIYSHGKVAVDVLDEVGVTHRIRFTRVLTVNLEVKMTLRVTGRFPVDGAAMVRKALAAYLTGFTAGEDLAHTSLYPVAYAIPGVAEVKGVALRRQSTGTFEAQNITAGPDEALRLPTANVSIAVEQYVDL